MSKVVRWFPALIVSLASAFGASTLSFSGDRCESMSRDLVGIGQKPFSSDEMVRCRAQYSPEVGETICAISRRSDDSYQAFIGKQYESGPGQLTYIKSYPTFDIAFRRLVEREARGECRFILNDRFENICKVIALGDSRYFALIGRKNSQRELDRVLMAPFTDFQDALTYIQDYEKQGACTFEWH